MRVQRTARIFLAAGMVLVLAPPSPAPASSRTAQSPSGGQIAFASTRDGDAEIFLMDANGSNMRQITFNHDEDHSPDWAPDGRHIVFVREPSGERNADLYVVDIVTGEERPFATKGYWFETDPVWSPNGKWIAFASKHPRADDGEVVAQTMDGQRRRAVAVPKGDAVYSDPSWSPDGRRLVFVEYLDESYDLYTTSFCCSRGHRRRALSDDPLQEWHPDWSPDGTQILFSRSASDSVFKQGLYTISPGGTDLRVVMEGLDARSGSWSPDGRTIVFYAQGGLGYDVYRVEADGTGLVRMTDEQGSDQHPDWSPVAPG